MVIIYRRSYFSFVSEPVKTVECFFCKLPDATGQCVNCRRPIHSRGACSTPCEIGIRCRMCIPAMGSDLQFWQTDAPDPQDMGRVETLGSQSQESPGSQGSVILDLGAHSASQTTPRHSNPPFPSCNSSGSSVICINSSPELAVQTPPTTNYNAHKTAKVEVPEEAHLSVGQCGKQQAHWEPEAVDSAETKPHMSQIHPPPPLMTKVQKAALQKGQRLSQGPAVKQEQNSQGIQPPTPARAQIPLPEHRAFPQESGPHHSPGVANTTPSYRKVKIENTPTHIRSEKSRQRTSKKSMSNSGHSGLPGKRAISSQENSATPRRKIAKGPGTDINRNDIIRRF